MEDSAATAAPQDTAAEERSDQLTSQAVLEDLERHYVQMREERDRLQEQLKNVSQQVSVSTQAQVSQQDLQRQLAQRTHEIKLGAEKIRALEEEIKIAKERTDRAQAEGDSLREEISRLSKNNTEATKQLASMEAQSRVQENEAIPLFREKQRLQTELDSLQAHANWLNQELEAKSKDYLRLKQEAHDRSLQFHLQLDQTTNDKDSAEARLEASEQMERELQAKIQQLSKDLLATKQELTQVEENSQDQVREERRLVQVQKEHLDRWQERYNDVVRQNESLKESATKAMELSQKELEDQRVELEDKCKQLLEEQKTRFEEKLLQLPASTTAAAITSLRRVAVDEDEEHMNLTDLYTAFEETKVALKKEEIQRKHWELQFKQVQKEIEDSRPRMRRQVKEYELAVDKVRDYEQRLEQAIADREDALADTKEARQEVSNLRRALEARRAESEELAKQVQALLVSRAGGKVDGSIPTTVRQVQSQNQQLLMEKNRLESTVVELKAQLDSDGLRNQLEAKESELSELRRLQTVQEEYVEKIVIERDLYRGIVATRDENLLGSEDEVTNAAQMLKKQSARSKKLEQLNEELEGKLIAANSERERAISEREAMSERLGRYEEHSLVLRKTIDDLERDLSAARGDAARAVSSSEYHKDKCKQSELSLERAHNELAHLSDAKKELQKVNAELQQSLSSANTAVSRIEDEKHLLESNMRLVKTQLETTKSAEARTLEENSQLRSEIARQGGISDSVRRIEATLTAKSENEKETMKEELERLSKKLLEEETKFSSQVENLNARIEEASMRIKDIESERQKAVAEARALDKLLADSKTEVKSLSEKCSTLEAQLRSAKKRLGESDDSEDPEVSMQARINDLASQLDAATAELTSLRERAKNYQKMSKDSETSLSQLTNAMNELKKEKEDEGAALKRQLENMKKQDAAKQGVIEELTRDLAGQREDREKIVSALQAEISALKAEMENNEKNAESSNEAALAMKMDIEAIRNDAALAHNNYERELQLHSQARSSLREAREKAEEEAKLRSVAEKEANSAKKELEQQRVIWEQEKSALSEEMSNLENTLKETREQNKALHSQMESLGQTVAKIQSSQADGATEKTLGASDNAELNKIISELREMVRFVRSENEMIQTQLDTAKRTAERERSAANVAKRSLDEARAELKILQSEKIATGGDAELVSKLASSEEQVKILRDSNKLLRTETEALQKKVSAIEGELGQFKASAGPTEKLKRDLNMKIASLEAEKESLKRDLESWKERVNSLVSKFNQIDPEEHKKLQERVATMEKEKESTDAWKKTTEEENTRIRTIAKNLNQKVREHKTLIEKQKSEIEKITAEKEKLASASSASSVVAKERDQLKGTVEKMKKDAASAKTQLEGASSHNDRLRETLRKFQTTIRDLKMKEKKLTAELEGLRSNTTVSKSVEKAEAGEEKEVESGEAASLGAQAEAPLPTVPGDGFKFGPSDKLPPQSVSSEKKTSPLRSAAPTFVPKKDTPVGSKSSAVSSAKQPEVKSEAPVSLKRKTGSDDSASKPATRRMSGEKKELSMKEKLIEKKRKLEEAKLKKRKAEEKKMQDTPAAAEDKPVKKAKIEGGAKDAAQASKEGGSAPVAVRSTSPAVKQDKGKETVGGDTTTESKAEEVSKVEKTDEKVAEEATGAPGLGGKEPGNPKAEGKEADKAAPVAKSSVFASGGAPAPTTFGQSSSILSGSGPTSFGAAASTGGASASSAFGGAFLNMKPPGSSSTAPAFSFGSSSSITLPTPAQPTTASSPFGAFSSGAPFGSAFGGGSAPTMSARPLFGTPAPKDSEASAPAEKSDENDDGEMADS